MNIKNLQKFLFIFMLISTLLLTACGGGGGGGSNGNSFDESEIIGIWYLNYEDELPVRGDKIPTIKFDANKTCSIVDYELNKYNDNKYWEGKGEPEKANGTWGISEGLVKVTVDGFTTSIEFDHESLRMSGENEGDKSIWTSEYKRQKYAETPKKDDPKKDEPTKDDPSKDTKMYSGGSGTVSDPYKIANATDLDNVRYNLDANFIQIADIDLSKFGSDYVKNYEGVSGKGWVPIGGDYDTVTDKFFTGTYNGNNKKITNLFMSRPSSNLGLFKQVATNSSLIGINIEISSSGITGFNTIGGLACYCCAKTVKNCSVKGDIGGLGGPLGGIFGLCSSASVVSCNSNCNILVDSPDSEIGSMIGGFAGAFAYSGKITNCKASGNVNANVEFVGGFAGALLDTIIENSSANGEIYTSNKYCGGFVGTIMDKNTNIIKCVSNGKAIADDGIVGGFAGANYGIIKQCVSNASGGSKELVSGGFVGLNSGNISKCYSKENGVSMIYDDIGAMVGGFAGWNNKGIIEDCYAEGDGFVYGKSSAYDVGAFVGNNETADSVINRCYAVGTGKASSLNFNYTRRAGGIAGSNYGTISNCVALGKEVDANSSVGRITGNNINVLNNNFAINSMKVGNAVPSDNIGTSAINGASISDSDAKNPSWWKNTAGWSESTWIFSTTGYPTLKDMPSLN